MYNFKLKLANIIIGAQVQYENTKAFCSEYLTDEKSDFSVAVDTSDVDFEREKSAQSHIKKGIPAVKYSDRYLETLALYRKIADELPYYDTFLFHGSAVAVDGECYIFTAKSGTGKSTHTRLWREKFADRAVMVNDDKPLIKVTDKGIIVSGTPWNGKHRLGNNISAPLKAVCMLNRSTENHIEPLQKRYAWQFFLQQAYNPSSASAMAKTLELLDKTASCAKLYSLWCNMDLQAAETAYFGMNDKRG